MFLRQGGDPWGKKVNFVFRIPGKNREPFLKAGYDEYLKRLSRFGRCSLEFLPEERPVPSLEKALKKEAETQLRLLKEKDALILVDIHAPEVDSLSFSKELLRLEQTKSTFVFVFGSSGGIDDSLRKRADFAFSLSKMTFTHYMALLLVLEQVYRSCKINAGEKYDK